MDDQKVISDQAVKDFRKLAIQKQEEKEKKANHSLLYGVTACVAAASLALAFTYTDGADKIREVFTKFAVHSEQEETSEPKTVSVNGNSVQAVTETPTPTETPKASQTPETSQAPGVTQTPGTTQTPTSSAAPSGSQTQETMVQGKEYIVKQGDTLTKISEQYYGNLKRIADICAANGMDKDDIIYPGQKIILPQ